ncbi:MAG: hypothetical protein JNK82_24150 [Myxococcaceae bacterium]|nr:hypothetical protein [Myxococcaceae bacterium]
MRKLGAAVVVLLACGTPGGGGTGGGSGTSGGSGGSGGSSSAGGAATAGGTATAGGGTATAGGAGTAGGGTATAGGSGATAGGGVGMTWVGPDGGISSRMGFFTTSRGMGRGGDFRGDAGDGLTGADRFCTELAGAIDPGLGAKTWRAYLSTSSVTARSRIGNGPWRNAKDTVIATSAANLHDEGGMNALGPTTNLDEGGNEVRFTNPGNVHDILTGASADGGSDDDHCNNWTSSATTFQGRVGHSNRNGTGGTPPTSWNSAHDNQSCAPLDAGGTTIQQGGGRGSFYCFESN